MSQWQTLEIHALHWANGALILWAFWWSFRRQRFYSILWGALGIFHFVGCLDLLIQTPNIDPNVIIHGQAIILLGNFLLLACLFLLDQGPLSFEPALLNRAPPKFFGTRSPAINRYLLLMAGIAFIAIAVQFKDGFEVANTEWSSQRMVEDPYFLRPLSTMLGFVFFPALWIAIRQKRIGVSLTFGLAVLTLFFLLGSRAMFTTIAAVIFIDLMTCKLKHGDKAIMLAGIGVVGYGLHTLLRVLRGLGLGGLIAAAVAGNLGTWIDGHRDAVGLGGEEDAYRTFYYVVEKKYDYYPYQSWVTPQRLLMIYIPSSFITSKPRDITTQLWFDSFDDGLMNESHEYAQLQKVASTEIGGSIHPHLWGDAFANGRLLGVFVYAIGLAIIATIAERLLLRATELSLFTIAPCLGVAYLFIARGSVVAGFGCVAYTLPLVILFALLSGTALFKPLKAPDISETNHAPSQEPGVV